MLSRSEAGCLQAVARSARVGHAAAINILCQAVKKAEESPHTTDNFGWTPLHRAAHAGHLDAVKELLKFLPIPASQAKAGAGCTDGEQNYAKRKQGAGAVEERVVTPLDVATNEEIKKVLQAALAGDGSSIKRK